MKAANRGGLRMTGVQSGPSDAGHSATPVSATLQATSASLAIPAAVSFASFAQLILVEAGLPQFAAHIPPSWSLAGLAVSAAISFAPLP